MVALGATIGLAGHLVMQGRIDHQTSRNKLLQAEIKALDKQLTEIQDLRAKIDALIARKEVIETLQRDRAQPVACSMASSRKCLKAFSCIRCVSRARASS